MSQSHWCRPFDTILSIFNLFVLSACEQSLDLRNDPIANKDEFRLLFLHQWAHCTVIEGNVAFVLMTNTNLTQDDYENFRLPNVREITGYVLLFQVE